MKNKIARFVFGVETGEDIGNHNSNKMLLVLCSYVGEIFNKIKEALFE